MKIYTSDTTDFNNNGLGFLTDSISCIIDDEINGNYQLTMEYIKDGKLAEYLAEENIIKCTVADGTEQLFRIKIVQKNFKTIVVTAYHIFYDLLNNFLEDAYPKNLNGASFLNNILSNTTFATSFTANSNISDTKSARYVRKNPVIAIMGDIDNSMVNLFGGELKRDNFTINFLTRIGNNNGVKLLFGKNITGIDVTVDITNVATRVMPQGFDGLLLPEKYVDSPLINNYPTPKIVKLEFNDVKYDPDSTEAGVYTDINDAYDALRAKVQEQYTNGLDKPQININVDWIELSKTNEYKNYTNLEKVNIGDTITANILDMDYETRVIATKYDALEERIINFQIGTFKPSIDSKINKITLEVEETLPTSILEEAQANATNLIASAMGGYVYKTQSELFIMDTNNPNTAQKVWRWNINGLGYSSSGINGPYGIAMTMDGKIVADFITTGTLSADRVSGGTLSGAQIIANSGTIGGWDIDSYKLYSNTTNGKVTGMASSDWPGDPIFFAGGGNPYNTPDWVTSVPFYVTNQGKLKATDADITGTIKGSIFKGSSDGVKLIIASDSSGYMSTNNCLELNYESDNSNILGVYGKFWNLPDSRRVYFKSAATGYTFIGSEGVYANKLKTPKLATNNIQTGLVTLNSSSEVYEQFSYPFETAPRVVITPITTASGVISPKIRAVDQWGFRAIIGGSGFNNIECSYIAIDIDGVGI